MRARGTSALSVNPPAATLVSDTPPSYLMNNTSVSVIWDQEISYNDCDSSSSLFLSSSEDNLVIRELIRNIPDMRTHFSNKTQAIASIPKYVYVTENS